MDGKCIVFVFSLSGFNFSCIPFGWHKQLRTGHSAFFFLCFSRNYCKMLLMYMKGQVSGENKSDHFLLLVSLITSFQPFFAKPVKWLQ